MNGYEWTAAEIDEMLTDANILYWRSIPYGWLDYNNNIDQFTQMLELFADNFGYEVSAVYDSSSWFDIAVSVYKLEQ
jgi:hypothetical protein